MRYFPWKSAAVICSAQTIAFWAAEVYGRSKDAWFVFWVTVGAVVVINLVLEARRQLARWLWGEVS